MRRYRAAGLLTAAIVLSAPAAPAHATDLAVHVTDARVTGGAEPTLVISGTVTNPGSGTVTSRVELVTTGPLTTRTALDALLSGRAPATRALPYSVDVPTLAAGSTTSWAVTAPMAQWASGWSGVLGVGVRSGTSIDLTAVPWFPAAKTADDPTQVTLAVRVATDSFDPLATTPDVSAATAEVERLERVVQPGPWTLWVDPAVRIWLSGLAGTPLEARATALQARLATADATVFGDARLDRLVASGRTDLLNELAPDRPTVYLPETVTTDTVKELGPRVLTVVGNDEAAGSSLNTMQTHVTVGGRAALVADRGAQSCFTASSAHAGSAGRCFAATVAMITAESPNVARHILVVTPRTWDPDALDTRQLAAALTQSTFATAVPLGSAGDSAAPVTLAGQTAPTKYPARTLQGVDDLLRVSHEVGALFPNATQAAQIRHAALMTLAAGTSKARAAELRARGMALGDSLTSGVEIETTGRFTIPSTTTEIPFTVVNGATEAVSVAVSLRGDNADRLSAATAETVTVESGQRVVVPVTVTITGVGTVRATAQLVAADGTPVGRAVRISVTTTASQRFARNLVWVALAALLMLAGNNWRRRRSAS